MIGGRIKKTKYCKSIGKRFLLLIALSMCTVKHKLNDASLSRKWEAIASHCHARHDFDRTDERVLFPVEGFPRKMNAKNC